MSIPGMTIFLSMNIKSPYPPHIQSGRARSQEGVRSTRGDGSIFIGEKFMGTHVHARPAGKIVYAEGKQCKAWSVGRNTGIRSAPE